MASTFFSLWYLGNPQKLLTTNQFLVGIYNIPYNYEYFLFQSAFSSLFNHRQISQSNREQCRLCCSSPCFRVLLCTHYGPLQCFSTYFRKLKETGVLQSIFPDYFLWLCSKELWNCISCIIRMWLLFCSIRVYISPHFLPFLLRNYSFLPNRRVARNKRGGGKDEPFLISVVPGVSVMVGKMSHSLLACCLD